MQKLNKRESKLSKLPLQEKLSRKDWLTFRKKWKLQLKEKLKKQKEKDCRKKKTQESVKN